MPSRPQIPALAGVALLAACASAPSPPPAAIARDVAVPPAVLAAVTGGALRLALPFCDPTPSARGVLVLPLAGGGWRLAAERRDEHWQPFGSHRLALVPAADPAAPPAAQSTALPASECRDDTGAHDVDLVVAPSARGATLVGHAPRELLAAIDCALALAEHPTTAVPGLEEPNLAAWAGHRLRGDAAAAEALGDHTQAHALRVVAARLAGTDAALQAQLCDDAERRGEVAAASDHAWLAALASRDPRQRGALAERLRSLDARHDDAEAWRTAARQELHLADPARAAALLHTARRLHDEPAVDYRLQSQLHRLRDDGEAAHANALLAREHAGLSTDAPTFVAELWLLAEPPRPAFARPTAAPAPAAPSR